MRGDTMIIVRNLLAFLIGLVVGSGVNLGLLTVGHRVIKPPEGADTSTLESLANSMHLFGPEQFLFPFLAHSLGTLAGATLGHVVAKGQRQLVAFAIGAAFLLGGIGNAYMLPAPAWFNIVDLVFAYVPMAWLACFIGKQLVHVAASAAKA